MNKSERVETAICEKSPAPHRFVLNAGVPQVARIRRRTESYDHKPIAPKIDKEQRERRDNENEPTQ